MSDQAETAEGAKTAEPVSDRAAIETLKLLLTASMKQTAAANDAQQVALLALTAIITLSPATAAVDAERLGVILETLTHGRPNGVEIRKRVADYVSLVVSLSRKLPEVLADAKKKAESGADGEAALAKSEKMN